MDPFKNYLFDAIGAMDGRDLAKEDTYEGDLILENADILAFWKWEESRQERGRVPAQLLDLPRLRVWEKRRLGDICQ